jgi:hypothetical protein
LPHSNTNRRTASGMLSFISVISVMTDITDQTASFVKPKRPF